MKRLTPHPTEDTAALVAPPARLLSLADHLRARCGLTQDDVSAAAGLSERLNLPLSDVLYRAYGCACRDLVAAESDVMGARQIDPVKTPPDIRLVHQWGVETVLQTGVLPWRIVGSDVIILVSTTERYQLHFNALRREFKSIRLAFATEDQIHHAAVAASAGRLAHRAETRVERRESCRDWSALRGGLILGGLVLLVLLALIWAPVQTLGALTVFTLLSLSITTALKAAAALSHLWHQPAPHLKAKPNQALPVFTVLIPLYREKAIADHLLRRLDAIDYPRELLDVCLVLEDDDDTTRAALGRIALTKWIRAITVPPGTVKTKPRALNYALDFTRGDIIAVYDAEDAPAPDQLRRVAATFAAAPDHVACLQGMLDYYNHGSNWLTRCFTIEYAGWFRVILPGLAKLGFVVPLGGTTLFFRRDILDRLGGWDAHNVTEDADLGIRLARRGYVTAFLDSVTEEEANGHFWPWVKQRSRWLKGYAVTYAVHMRRPIRLWRDLGTKRFLGLNILFGGTLVQFLLAPLLWSFWLLPFGVPHPVAEILPAWAFWTMAGLFVATELTNLAIAGLGLKRAGKLRLWPWAISLQVYFPLGTAAVYKGLTELAWKPFYWDKTAHGVLMPDATRPPQPSARPASTA